MNWGFYADETQKQAMLRASRMHEFLINNERFRAAQLTPEQKLEALRNSCRAAANALRQAIAQSVAPAYQDLYLVAPNNLDRLVQSDLDSDVGDMNANVRLRKLGREISLFLRKYRSKLLFEPSEDFALELLRAFEFGQGEFAIKVDDAFNDGKTETLQSLLSRESYTEARARAKVKEAERVQKRERESDLEVQSSARVIDAIGQRVKEGDLVFMQVEGTDSDTNSEQSSASSMRMESGRVWCTRYDLNLVALELANGERHIASIYDLHHKI